MAHKREHNALIDGEYLQAFDEKTVLRRAQVSIKNDFLKTGELYVLILTWIAKRMNDMEGFSA